MRWLVAIAAVAVCLVPAGARAGAPSAAALEEQIVCPTCRTTVALSDAPIARRIKLFIRDRIVAGDSGDEIKAKLVDQFGVAVLAEPQRHGFDLLAWLLPAVGLALGLVTVGGLAWMWSRRRDQAPDAPLDPDLERRLDEELARFEG